MVKNNFGILVSYRIRNLFGHPVSMSTGLGGRAAAAAGFYRSALEVCRKLVAKGRTTSEYK